MALFEGDAATWTIEWFIIVAGVVAIIAIIVLIVWLARRNNKPQRKPLDSDSTSSSASFVSPSSPAEYADQFAVLRDNDDDDDNENSPQRRQLAAATLREAVLGLPTPTIPTSSPYGVLPSGNWRDNRGPIESPYSFIPSQAQNQQNTAASVRGGQIINPYGVLPEGYGQPVRVQNQYGVLPEGYGPILNLLPSTVARQYGRVDDYGRIPTLQSQQ